MRQDWCNATIYNEAYHQVILAIFDQTQAYPSCATSACNNPV